MNTRKQVKKKSNHNTIIVRREKVLKYFICLSMIFIFITGILLANGMIKFPTNNIESSTPIKLSPTIIITTTIQQENLIVTIVPIASISPTPTTKLNSALPTQTECKISGCNGEICTDESLGDVSTICLYQEKYACYKKGTCERQSDGRCSWTQTDELKSCLDNY